jgi:hypothetical protein
VSDGVSDACATIGWFLLLFFIILVGFFIDGFSLVCVIRNIVSFGGYSR